MPPLYKRYIPPKPSTTPAAAPASNSLSVSASASSTNASTKPVATAAGDDESKKRKRVRSEDEVAERKAKKLRKKGIDPDTVDLRSDVKPAEIVAARAENTLQTNDPGATNEPHGEFAHVKNTKKRHKLEKEARQARKAAQKADKEKSGIREDIEQSQSSQVHDESDNVHGINERTSPAKETFQPQKRKKKRKKEPDMTLESPPAGEAASGSQRRNEREDARDSRDVAPQAKERRHKLESILKEPQTEPNNKQTEGDENLKKHGNMLSKFKKSMTLAQAAPQIETTEEEQPGPEPEVIGLAPFPQPGQPPFPRFVPDSLALPEWLAKPTVISSDSNVSFADLKLEPRTVQRLSKIGFEDALPVQQALIPLLLPPGVAGTQHLPSTESQLPDVAVGAPTGSGKTIAYLLPIVESLRQIGDADRLRALIVVPTRELVVQVAAVAQSLAGGSSIKVGTATGTGSFKDEQTKLIKLGRQYDPESYRELMSKAQRHNYPSLQDSDESESSSDELDDGDPKEQQRIKDACKCLVDHVPTYKSSVDILVATPGRLLEHLSNTLGFCLVHLEWLILDEADKLLNLQYDGFLETVNNEISRPRREDEQDGVERCFRSHRLANKQREKRVRKVVLSATMTKDISKLVELRLQLPQMIVVRGTDQAAEIDLNGGVSTGIEGVKQVGDSFELPPTLSEYCVPVGDGSEKPLYLVELLRSRILNTNEARTSKPDAHADRVGESDEQDREAESPQNSDSSSATDSSSSVSSMTSSSESSSNDEASDDEVDSFDQQAEKQSEVDAMIHPERTAMLDRLSKRQTDSSIVSTILIFTSSKESANRLAHLIKQLQPEWASWINTMTNTDRKSKPSAKVLANEPTITISTDRAGRGLDLIGGRTVTHVIQYDVPRAATGYVHRVGRTARAGRTGEAWTLYTHSQARWFLKEVAYPTKSIKRSEDVEKVKLTVDDDGLRDRLREAVESMRDDVFGRGDVK